MYLSRALYTVIILVYSYFDRKRVNCSQPGQQLEAVGFLSRVALTTTVDSGAARYVLEHISLAPADCTKINLTQKKIFKAMGEGVRI